MTPDEEGLLKQLEERLGRARDPASSGPPLKPYKFRMAEVEGFRYRVKVTVTKATDLGGLSVHVMSFCRMLCEGLRKLQVRMDRGC